MQLINKKQGASIGTPQVLRKYISAICHYFDSIAPNAVSLLNSQSDSDKCAQFRQQVAEVLNNDPVAKLLLPMVILPSVSHIFRYIEIGCTIIQI